MSEQLLEKYLILTTQFHEEEFPWLRVCPTPSQHHGISFGSEHTWLTDKKPLTYTAI